MDINDTYYHPNLLLKPALWLALWGLILFLSGGFSYEILLWWGAIITGLYMLFELIDVVRVRKYVEKQGASLTSIKWAPFGPGWFSFTHRNSTIYGIEFADPMGKEFSEHVRVSLWHGVERTG